MSAISQLCDRCRNEITSVFGPGGTRTEFTVPTNFPVTTCCFVADTIIFQGDSQLIFQPQPRNERKAYCDPCAVICRKLVIVGGSKSTTINPCNPGDPGTKYLGNNAISWLDRLSSAATGAPPSPPAAADGTDFGGYSDQGQGNDGLAGNPGQPGGKGNPGQPGYSRAPNFVLVALEVEIKSGGNLIVDFSGQNGGDGGKGMDGGKGGRGMDGNEGHSDTTWPGEGCDQAPGNGGKGGKGGKGGDGGDGGHGGDGGNITLVGPAAILSGVLHAGGPVQYEFGGGLGGGGGFRGNGPLGGGGGLPGAKSSLCDKAMPGDHGDPGTDGNPGLHGDPGKPGAPVNYEPLTNGTCADQIPMPVTITTPLTPSHFCRGFSTPGIGDASITGQFMSQVTAVTTSLPGITVTIQNSSTDTQLDLHFDIAGNSGTGTGDLILKRAFGPDISVANAISVDGFKVLSVTPATGARGNHVSVVIAGNCFDPTAAIQNVNASGLGVNAINVAIVDEHTINCVFDITSTAAQGARDITVQNGTRQHTLIGGFTVT